MTLSNKLTLSRIFLIPFFMIAAFPLPYQETFPTWLHYVRIIAALVFFVVAELTDIWDGKLARKRNEVTDLGKFLDPIADKLLVTAALLCFCAEWPFYVWPSMIILIREFAVSGLRQIAAVKGKVIAAGKLGKIKTTLQTTSLTTLLSAKVLGLIWSPLNYWITIAGHVVMCLAVVMTIVSGIEYFVKNAEVFK
ncbi:MAG: CDP-diacylglycerol--glycerol-3-phosphate 3-phosphatidyltransferase [Clostridia bacterium]|nr:CDP-diacylglycerol--glycerol-3-phosphate 3-phosphatidyltransferase [Clostridia bacterium]